MPLFRQDHLVHDMNDAIACENIGGNDLACAHILIRNDKAGTDAEGLPLNGSDGRVNRYFGFQYTRRNDVVG